MAHHQTHPSHGDAALADRPHSQAAAVRPIRACMFTAESRSGHARYTREVLTALAGAGPARGVSVELVTSRDLAGPFQTERYPIHAVLPPLVDRKQYQTRLGWAASRVCHYAGRDQRFLRWVREQTDLDLVHFQEYTPWLAPLHFPWLRRQGLAVVSTVHNIANHGHASHSYMRFSQRCWRRAWRSCSALIVHTSGLRDSLGEFLGPGHPPIFVTEHGVWEERTSPVTPPETPAVGVPGRLLFFGVLRSNKGLHVLLSAMRHLPGCVLTIAGEPDFGAYQDGIRAQVAGLPAGQVELHARFIEEGEIARFFDQSQVVVLPYTQFESQSGVLHQALAHGRPVVASDVGGLGESVRQWGVGEVVRPDDDRALADGVLRLLGPERYQEAAGRVAQARAERTWDRQAEATLDVYRAVVS